MKGNRSTEEVEAIYHRHIKMVYQICLMLMKNVPDAEDAAQTVFRKGDWSTPNHSVIRSTKKAWLIVTARNECKNQLKHWWRTHRESEEAMEKLTWEQLEDGELWDAVLTLPQHQRMALYLCYYQGYTAREAAEIMGKNPSTVRTWLVQGRKKLKEFWRWNTME